MKISLSQLRKSFIYKGYFVIILIVIDINFIILLHVIVWVVWCLHESPKTFVLMILSFISSVNVYTLTSIPYTPLTLVVFGKLEYYIY